MERIFFFTDSCLTLVQFYPLAPPTPTPWTLNCHTWSLPFLSNERKHQRHALLAIRHSWVDSTDDGFLLQRASNAESASISWCHHERCLMIMITTWYWDRIILTTVVSMIIELRGFVYIHWIFMNNFGALQIHACSSVVTLEPMLRNKPNITYFLCGHMICASVNKEYYCMVFRQINHFDFVVTISPGWGLNLRVMLTCWDVLCI